MGSILAVFGLARGAVSLVPPWAWKVLAILLAFGSVYLYADRKATYRERAACEAAAQRAQKAADAQDVKAAIEGKQQAETVVGQLTDQKKVDNAIIEDLKVKLASAPLNAPCYYPDVAPTGRVRARPAGKGAGH